MSQQVSNVGPSSGTGDYRKFYFDLNNLAGTKEIDTARIPLEGTREAWRLVDITSHNGTMSEASGQVIVVQVPMIGTDGSLGFYKPTTAINWAISGTSDAPSTWLLGIYLQNESGAGERGTTTMFVDDTVNGVVYDQDIFVYYNSTQALDTGIIQVTLERMKIDKLGKITCLFNQARKTRQRAIAED